MDGIHKVALVEDNEPVRRSLVNMLAHYGYEAAGFGTAEKFLSDCDPDMIDCMVVDLRLPGMNGCSLIRRLRENGVEIPMIMISGNLEVDAFETVRHDEKTWFLNKPFRPSQLLGLIEQVIHLEPKELASEVSERVDHES